MKKVITAALAGLTTLAAVGAPACSQPVSDFASKGGIWAATCVGLRIRQTRTSAHSYLEGHGWRAQNTSGRPFRRDEHGDYGRLREAVSFDCTATPGPPRLLMIQYDAEPAPRTGAELVADLRGKLGPTTATDRCPVDAYFWGTNPSGAAVDGGPVAKLTIDPHGFGDLRVSAGDA